MALTQADVNDVRRMTERFKTEYARKVIELCDNYEYVRTLLARSHSLLPTDTSTYGWVDDYLMRGLIVPEAMNLTNGKRQHERETY